MPIPDEYKKLQCFQPVGENELKALAIKPTENPFNKIYFGVETNADGDETLLACYLPNYAPERPIVKKISSADLIEKYPNPEDLINKFANLIIFGVGGTFIEEAMPNKSKSSFKPTLKIPLRNKVEKLAMQTQICMIVATLCEDIGYVTILFRNIFSYDRHLSEEEANKKIKNTFKGLRNKGKRIELKKFIDHCESSKVKGVKKPDEDIFYIRNVLIVNNSKLDIQNPEQPVYIITPDEDYNFLDEIDIFIKDHSIDYQKIMYFDQSQEPKAEHNWLSPVTNYNNPHNLPEGWLRKCLEDSDDEETTPAKLAGRSREEMEKKEQQDKKQKTTSTTLEDEGKTSYQRYDSYVWSKNGM